MRTGFRPRRDIITGGADQRSSAAHVHRPVFHQGSSLTQWTIRTGSLKARIIAPQRSRQWLSALGLCVFTPRRERDPRRTKFELPLLYLHRNRDVTPSREHTLEMSITGSLGGTRIKLQACSHHVNASTGEHHTVVAPVAQPRRPCTREVPCTLKWVFCPG